MSLASLRIGQSVERTGTRYRVAGIAIGDNGIEPESLAVFEADKSYGNKAVSGVWLLMFLRRADAESLAVEGGEPSDKLHLTVGALNTDTTEDKQDIINSVIEHVAAKLPPVKGKIGGVGQFTDGGDGAPVIALFDSPELVDWRGELLDALTAVGVEMLDNHGYTPHITLQYAEEPLGQLPEMGDREVTLDTLSLVWDGERQDFQLTGEDIKAKHSRSRCMNCKNPPLVDVHWADGRGRAWFCLDCFKSWAMEDDREIVRAWYVPSGEVPEKMGDNGEQVRKLGERLNTEQVVARIEKLVEGQKGGPGSGHHGHGGRPGQRGGSVPSGSTVITSDFFSMFQGKDLIEESIPGSARRRIIDVLSNGRVRRSQIEGLTRITTESPDEEGCAWEDDERVVARYHRYNKSIHIRPRSAGSERTLSHELGHHVRNHWMKETEQGRRTATRFYTKFRRFRDKYRGGFVTDDMLSQVGLRHYSLTNTSEFMADSWAVYHLGTDSQRKALAQGVLGVDSLDELFG